MWLNKNYLKSKSLLGYDSDDAKYITDIKKQTITTFCLVSLNKTTSNVKHFCLLYTDKLYLFKVATGGRFAAHQFGAVWWSPVCRGSRLWHICQQRIQWDCCSSSDQTDRRWREVSQRLGYVIKEKNKSISVNLLIWLLTKFACFKYCNVKSI